jgi:lipopolysaccharide transport protein LptA
MSGGALVYSLLCATLLLSAQLSAARAEQAAPAVRLGVAPFYLDGVEASGSDRLATQLADQLASREVERVVPPSEFAAAPTAHPTARVVRTWAERAGVEVVVLGHVTAGRAAGSLDLAVELRSGHSGASLSAYRVELVPGPSSEASLHDLASSILASLGQPGDALPRVAAAAASDAKRDSEAGSSSEPDLEFDAESDLESSAKSNSALSVSGLRSDDPIAINSQELEVITNDEGGRTVIFDHDVRVVQGDVRLWADHLDATYAKGQSQPDRLRAKGQVRVEQGDKRATCDEAVYLREEKTVVCTGRASLQQECDIVRGEEIRFDLDREGVRVIGAASVQLKPECESAVQ